MKKNPLVYLFGENWKHSKDTWKVVKYWFQFIIANTIDMILAPLIVARIMNIIQGDGVTSTNITSIEQCLMGLLGLEFLFWMFHGPARVTEMYNAAGVKASVRTSLIAGLFRLPLSWHNEHHSGETIDRIEKNASSLHSFSNASFLVIGPIVKLVVTFSMLVRLSGIGALVIVAMFGLITLIITHFDRKLVAQYNELNVYENSISELINDFLGNITTLITLRAESHAFKFIVERIEKPFSLFKKNFILNEWKWFLVNFSATLTLVLVLGVYFRQHIGVDKTALVGSVYLLFRYLEEIKQFFFAFADRYGEILHQRAGVEGGNRIAKHFKEPKKLVNYVPSDWKTIELAGVDFAYNSKVGASLHLSGVSVKLERGKRYAFVGSSGGGKSTLLKLIRGLYEPKQATVTVDGTVIPNGFDGIADNVVLVPQDSEIFALTVKENITFGAPISEEKVAKLIHIAQLTKVIEGLPQGLDSKVYEKGVNLSGGQKQRLAGARGLAARDFAPVGIPSIVCLDEPTSGLDKATEKGFISELLDDSNDVTVIMAVHNLSVIPRFFDYVYMFEEGKVVGSGSFGEMRAHCPQFNALWQIQHGEMAA